MESRCFSTTSGCVVDIHQILRSILTVYVTLNRELIDCAKSTWLQTWLWTLGNLRLILAKVWNKMLRLDITIALAFETKDLCRMYMWSSGPFNKIVSKTILKMNVENIQLCKYYSKKKSYFTYTNYLFSCLSRRIILNLTYLFLHTGSKTISKQEQKD